MMDGIDLAQFGLAASLIGAFFIPFILNQRQTIKDKDGEIVRLNNLIQDGQDKRLADIKEALTTVIEPIKQFNNTANTLINLVNKNAR